MNLLTKKYPTNTYTTAGLYLEDLAELVLGNKAPKHLRYQSNNPKKVARQFHLITKQLAERVNQIITMDEVLRKSILFDFRTLSEDLNKFTDFEDYRNVMVRLYKVIAKLLGFFHSDGMIYRTPIYFQTRDQEIIDLIKSHGYKEYDQTKMKSAFERCLIVQNLREEGFKIPEIASIMRLSDYEVRKILSYENMSKRIESLKKDGYSTLQIFVKLSKEYGSYDLKE